ncbi:hypothetical protein Pmani_034236 [Petrolisthes manimaculis]|uniref:Peroxisomal membrane protein PEX16 n=1 Tax=Petrolisthes manimaculis TaxID=1843537 RepID=A0AAE1NP10_9EUCA|nr:hypothetical protein Pmani_034236 [Petrolisthes manimaculis]
MSSPTTGKFQQWFKQYKTWIMNNPQGASEMEAFVKWGSYILAGRLKHSTLLCEIVYSGSRLFELFNDFLIKGTLPQLTIHSADRLKVLLTVLEYVEVLVEVAAVQLWGETGRWAVVTLIQTAKCIGRFFLLLRHKTHIVPSPPIKPLDRRAAVKSGRDQQMFLEQGNGPEVMRLPRSGRVMRTLAGAPPTHQRIFTTPCPPNNNVDEPIKSRVLPTSHLVAEVMHVLRPMCHLGSMYLFGQQAWTPWILSLGMDVTSLRLYSEANLTTAEKLELAHRRINLLYYLMRSPVFHTVTHKRIQYLLATLSRRVPLARMVCVPLMEYIPQWQKIYAYTWS